MLLTAWIMGVAGSIHCAGMCSPLAMAVTSTKSAVIGNRILYNLGRIITYGVLGTMAATAGYILPFGKFQNAMSIVLGVSLIIMAIVGVTGIRIPLFTGAIVKFTVILKKAFSEFIRHKNPAALLLLGGLNGLLPCGLTFLALSFCLTVNTPLDGFMYMFMFGVGTLPVMLGFVSVLGFASNRLGWSLHRMTTGLMVISGLLLIARVFLVHLPEGKHQPNIVDIVICR